MSSPGGVPTARMLMVTGKGGVGKTLTTAALGDALARAGRRVLLVEIDPRESLYHVLAAAPSGGERIRVPLFAGGELAASHPADRHGALWIQNLQPKHVIEQMVREHLRVEMLARRVLSSTVFQHFIESAPGLREMAALAYSMRALQGEDGRPPEVDTIVLDAPATGHGVSLLAAPRVVEQVIHEGPFGRMAREMTAFVADPARLGVVVVTRAEEVPVVETCELFTMLEERVRRTPDLLVVNSVYPPLPDEADAVAAAGDVGRMWAERRRTNERELDVLASRCPAPHAILPLLPIDAGPRLVAALGRHLVPLLDIAEDAA